jgi:hypothetical protein
MTAIGCPPGSSALRVVLPRAGVRGRPPERQDDTVLIVRATKKLLQRLGRPTLGAGEGSTTLLGEWYATALFWRPQVVLLVNEPTLLPVLMPLAPAATLAARIPAQIAAVLSAHGAPVPIVDEEVRRMQDWRIGPTANRSVVGIMNEFTFLAEAWCDDRSRPDLPALALRLARTPCGPLYRKHISPDRELAALLGSLTDATPPAGDEGRPAPDRSDQQ